MVLYKCSKEKEIKEIIKMTITVEKDAARLINDLKGNEPTSQFASSFDFAIDTETYMVLGLKYIHTNNKHLKQRILDYLTEINFHS